MSSGLMGPGSGRSRPTRMQAIGECSERMGRIMKLVVCGQALVKYCGRRTAIVGARAFWICRSEPRRIAAANKSPGESMSISS